MIYYLQEIAIICFHCEKTDFMNSPIHPKLMALVELMLLCGLVKMIKQRCFASEPQPLHLLYSLMVWTVITTNQSFDIFFITKRKANREKFKNCAMAALLCCFS